MRVMVRDAAPRAGQAADAGDRNVAGAARRRADDQAGVELVQADSTGEPARGRSTHLVVLAHLVKAQELDRNFGELLRSIGGEEFRVRFGLPRPDGRSWPLAP